MSILSFLDIGMKIIDKIFPDPEQKAKAHLELAKLQQAGEFKELEATVQLAIAQTDINKVEAANEHIFISGWRPFIGWVCGMAFAYHFVLQPFLAFLFASAGHNVVLPIFNMDTLSTALFGLLGLGGFRTIEKIKR